MKTMTRIAVAVLGLTAFHATAQTADPARDRQSILAMRGEHDVDFEFDETVLLQPGYARAPASRSAGEEVVVVVEDTPTKIVLQHLLLDVKSGYVTKHWRQDWTYEAKTRFEYDTNLTWRVRTLTPEQTRGAWTQCVYEVDDAPRYCGSGRWDYADGAPTWTSDVTYRPLPRREYTRRSDYNILEVVNRHTIVPGGWTHEQFNTKVLRKPDGTRVAIAREFGFDDYHDTTDVDFKPAYDYWKNTRDYWARVRTRWATLLSQPPGLHLKTKIDGMALIEPLFEQADDAAAGKRVADAKIDKAFTDWVEPAGQ